MRVLFFIEDPGACSYMKNIPQYLNKLKFNSIILTNSASTAYLESNNLKHKIVDSYASLLKVFDDYKAKLVCVGTSQNRRSLSLRLIKLAQKNNIPSIGFVDSPADPEYRFSGETNDPLLNAPNYLIVADETTRKNFEKLGFNKDKIQLLLNPKYEELVRLKSEYNQNKVNRLKTDVLKIENKKIVVFIDEHSNDNDARMFRKNDYNFKGRQELDYRNEIIVSEILNILVELNLDYYFIVRLHPKSKKSDYKSLLNKIDYFHTDQNPIELLLSSDVIIGMTSALLVEALYLGKNVISILPRDDEKKWAPPLLKEHLDFFNQKRQLERELRRILNYNKSIRLKKPLMNPNGSEAIFKKIILNFF